MKRFKEHLNEDFDPAIFNADGGISIKDPTVVDAINSNLEIATNCGYRTPYNALEEIRKVLAYYKIFLPKGIFLDQNHGNDVFEVSQFGEKMGMNDQGEVVTASDSPLFIYFEWSLNEEGMYDSFASIVDQNELDEILADFDSEVESDEDLTEEHNMGAHSKMLYKIVNKMKAEKQSDDVDAYIEHEKQGKTFTQMCEEPMPDLKKKMGAKKVSLPNMMKKEETEINEVKKKSLIGKVLRHREAVKKGWGTFGKAIVADTDDQARKHVRNANRYDSLSKTGKASTKPLDEIADTAKGKEAVRLTVHRADATVVDSAINPPRSKKGKREAKNAMKTIDRGIAVHKKKGGVLDNYLKRSYGLKEEEQLDELHGKSSVSKDDMKKHIAKKHDAAWEKTRELRKKRKTFGPGKDEGNEHRNRLGKIYNKLEEENLQEISKKKLGDYIKAASHDVATKSAATGRYADRANRARDEFKKGDYSNFTQGKKDDEFAEKMFKKSWNRRKGIAKAADKLTKEEKNDVPFDMPTEKPSTPYKNPKSKAKQLARAAMKKAKSEKK